MRYWILAALLMVACKGPEILTCSVAAVPGGSRVTCPDGTNAFIADGANGAPGADGAPGASVTVTVEPAGDNCIYGGAAFHLGDQVVYVCNGAPGLPGTPGVPGVPGEAGTPGTVITVAPLPPGDAHCLYGGVVLTAEGQPLQYICNGAPGAPGTCTCTDEDGDSCHHNTDLCPTPFELRDGKCQKHCNDHANQNPDTCPNGWWSPVNSCANPPTACQNPRS